MTERDDAKDEAEENEAEENEAEDDVEEEAEAKPAKRVQPKSKKARREGASTRDERARPAPAPASGSAASRAIIVGVLALAAGGAAGWFGHEARAKAKLSDTSAPATAGSSGPCQDWQKKLCASSGDESATCQQAKGAAELLTPATCETALLAVPATLAKVKAARASCDTLVGKLCTDLPKGSSTCKMVQERTKSFPTERCKELLEHYAEVLPELQQIDQMGGPEQMMGGPQGMPPGMPQGMPPGMPQGMPPGMPGQP
ncbi:MAG TPA: hypothetical protein VM686_00105 [Polyangiaceae bacterium]|nr:hypothetical protein [Polyangiaceae bacterium]